jgi:hypothetical protein
MPPPSDWSFPHPSHEAGGLGQPASLNWVSSEQDLCLSPSDWGLMKERTVSSPSDWRWCRAGTFLCLSLAAHSYPRTRAHLRADLTHPLITYSLSLVFIIAEEPVWLQRRQKDGAKSVWGGLREQQDKGSSTCWPEDPQVLGCPPLWISPGRGVQREADEPWNTAPPTRDLSVGGNIALSIRGATTDRWQARGDQPRSSALHCAVFTARLKAGGSSAL